MIQPHIYRAPEATFEMPWGAPADIWNVACLVITLVPGPIHTRAVLTELHRYGIYSKASICSTTSWMSKDTTTRSGAYGTRNSIYRHSTQGIHAAE